MAIFYKYQPTTSNPTIDFERAFLPTESAVNLHEKLTAVVEAQPEDMPIAWHQAAIEASGLTLSELDSNDFHALQAAAAQAVRATMEESYV